MSQRLVNCKKLGKNLPGLDHPPLKGDLGEKIYQQISEEAWQLWLAHQTMLINEYRLNVIEKSSITFLQKEMVLFLFENKVTTPPDYQPKDTLDDTK